jgi:IS1 family transposase
MANVISMEKRIAVIAALVEGCSVRSTVRLTGVSKGAVLRLLVAVGAACTEYHDHDRVVRNVTAKRVQVDEIWSFVGCKQKNVTEAKMEAGICGDIWTFTAIEPQSKLIISWMAGRRDAGCATEFLRDVESRLSNRVQLTTDGHKMYLTAVPDAFAEDIDFAQLVKIYGNNPEGATRYSPAQCLGTKRIDIIGSPDHEHISTSYVERQNLNMRMNMRRFTRLTNAFSKKLENHVAMLALFHMHYNFVRIHQTLKVTPAMAAGVTPKLWEMSDMVKVLEDWEASRAAA